MREGSRGRCWICVHYLPIDYPKPNLKCVLFIFFVLLGEVGHVAMDHEEEEEDGEIDADVQFRIWFEGFAAVCESVEEEHAKDARNPGKLHPAEVMIKASQQMMEKNRDWLPWRVPRPAAVQDRIDDAVDDNKMDLKDGGNEVQSDEAIIEEVQYPEDSEMVDQQSNTISPPPSPPRPSTPQVVQNSICDDSFEVKDLKVEVIEVKSDASEIAEQEQQQFSTISRPLPRAPAVQLPAPEVPPNRVPNIPFPTEPVYYPLDYSMAHLNFLPVSQATSSIMSLPTRPETPFAVHQYSQPVFWFPNGFQTGFPTGGHAVFTGNPPQMARFGPQNYNFNPISRQYSVRILASVAFSKY